MRKFAEILVVIVAALTVFDPFISTGVLHVIGNLVSGAATSDAQNGICLWWAIVSALPLVTRGIPIITFVKAMHKPLKEETLARDAYRAFILALAGFSFTGMAALAVLDSSAQKKFSLAILFLVISFLSFVAALNWQIYKQRRWQHELAGALIEVAVLAMLLSVVAIVSTSAFPAELKWAVGAAAVLIWGSDHVTRLVIDVQHIAKVNDA